MGDVAQEGGPIRWFGQKMAVLRNGPREMVSFDLEVRFEHGLSARGAQMQCKTEIKRVKRIAVCYVNLHNYSSLFLIIISY